MLDRFYKGRLRGGLKKKKKSREFSLTPRPPPPGGESREFIYDFLPIPEGQIRVVLSVKRPKEGFLELSSVYSKL